MATKKDKPSNAEQKELKEQSAINQNIASSLEQQRSELPYKDVEQGFQSTLDKTENSNPIIMGSNIYNVESGERARTYDNDSQGGGGVLVFLLLVALVVMFIVGIMGANTNKMQVMGKINGNAVAPYGESVKLNYVADKSMTSNGKEEVVWYVNEKEMQRKPITDKNAYSYNLTKANVGSNKVKVTVGKKVYSNYDVKIDKPILKVKVKDMAYEYGSEMPKIEYDINGLVDGDKKDIVSLINKNVPTNSVGVYRTNSYALLGSTNKYNTVVEQGVISVMPKELKVENVICKEYDGSNTLKVDNFKLVGVKEGDEVCAECDQLYFEDKNVGNKKISTYNIKLTGKNAGNYYLCNELCGEIKPKAIALNGIKAKNKMYDTNTKAELAGLGQLEGVVDGDILAIGDISANFETNAVGKGKNIKVDNITLIGKDKDNYRFENYPSAKADIFESVEYGKAVPSRRVA
ncbi:MAG: YDG domain-containing protein [Clostridia bacterium]